MYYVLTSYGVYRCFDKFEQAYKLATSIPLTFHALIIVKHHGSIAIYDLDELTAYWENIQP